MVRKLALAVSLALGTLSVPVHALGLGELDSKSTLNQNFNGDIKLLSVSPDELGSVRVKLADQDAFSRAGVDRPFYLSLLKFEPLLAKGGKPVVRVTSDFPIREPFLNFLVEVNWPKGRLLREYTVLLDPPTTTRRRPPAVKPASKVAAPSVKPTVSPAPAASKPAPASGKSVPVAMASEYGPVKANDTAWGIAKKIRPRGVSMEQMMMALLKANPQAFINNDIIRLRRGRILRVPAIDEIQELTRAQARAAYRQQQDQWLARRDAKLQGAAQAKADAETDVSVDNTDTTAMSAEAAAVEPPDQLRIATARPEGEGEAGAGDDDAVSATSGDLKSRLIAARENAETSRQEAETLRSRVGDLQERLQNMQKLLSLKDEQLAQLQDNVVQKEAAGEAESAVPPPAGEAIPDDVTFAKQVDPSVIAEQAAAEEPAVGEMVADEPSAATEVLIEDADSTPVADAAKAIDDAVADLVGETAPVVEDYQIEDIPPQIDPDRVVEGGAVETAVDMPAPDAVSMVETDLGIPPQIDPDRIVLGLDEPPVSLDMPGEGEVVVDTESVVSPVDAEVVIEGATGLPDAVPGDAEPLATGETDATVAVEPAAEPAPAPVEPPAAQTNSAGGILPASVAAMVEKNIVPIAAGGVVLLGLIGWLFTRGRRKQDEGGELLAGATAGSVAAAVPNPEPQAPMVDEPILDPESLADLPDSSFLDDFSPSDINALQDETGEVDPVSEADVYIAYGRYQQAEELLRQAMERDPERLALRHKLLEVHYATRDVDAYTALAQDMVDAGQDTADEEAWTRAQDMGRELAPENTMFALKEGESSWEEGVAGTAVAGAVAGAAANTVDTDTLSLEDVELSELTAAYEEEASSLSELDPPSEVSISLDLDEASELKAPAAGVEQVATTSGLDDMAPLEFEMPDADSEATAQADEDSLPGTLDLDSMMAEAEKVVDQDKAELSLDSDFSAAELQAQLDELSDLSALDSNLDEAPAEVVGGEKALGLVTEDLGPANVGLDEPLSLDTAFDAGQPGDEADSLDVLELDSAPSGDEEVATKLDLARAYVEMGDDDGARSILEEVVTEGSDSQRGEAKQLLADLA